VDVLAGKVSGVRLSDEAWADAKRAIKGRKRGAWSGDIDTLQVNALMPSGATERMPLRAAIDMSLNTFLLLREFRGQHQPATRRKIERDLRAAAKAVGDSLEALGRPNVRMYGPDRRELLPALRDWIQRADLTLGAFEGSELPGPMAPKDGPVAGGQQAWHSKVNQDPAEWLISRLCEGFEEAFSREVTDSDDGAAPEFIRAIVQQVLPDKDNTTCARRKTSRVKQPHPARAAATEFDVHSCARLSVQRTSVLEVHCT
jgi:hypothetical protein